MDHLAIACSLTIRVISELTDKSLDFELLGRKYNIALFFSRTYVLRIKSYFLQINMISTKKSYFLQIKSHILHSHCLNLNG